MSFRYRKRIKLLPGVHLNLSKSGITTSIGVRGASMTFGKKGTYVNTGIPGTGISYRQRLHETPHTASVSIADNRSSESPMSKQHHLHWWKVGLFIATMVAAGATKNDGVIGLFWIAWFGYWLFLLVRVTIRSIKKGAESGKA